MKNVLIYGYDYSDKSGGVRALHVLSSVLRGAGFDVSMTCEPRAQDVKRFNQMPVPDDTLVIYPEIVQGNPLKAKRVMRYILAERPYWNAEPGDELLVWSKHFSKHIERQAGRAIREDEYLRLPITDTALFNPYHHEERKLITAYEVSYKGALVIDQGWPLYHHEIAGLLKSSLYTVVWRHTAIIEEALLCGTPVLIKSPLSTEGEYRLHGIAHDESELEQAAREAPRAWGEYQAWLSSLPKTYERFFDRVRAL